MDKRFIMTAFGKDRVGIVADVTELLYEHECNLEDTTMNILSDEFTLNLLFSCKNEDVERALSQECRRLEFEKGISAFVRALPDADDNKENGYQKCVLHFESLDQVGIVYKTSKFLAENNLSVMHLNSSAKPSPQSGTTLHCMDIHIKVPAEISLDQVENDLDQMADELQVDIQMVR